MAKSKVTKDILYQKEKDKLNRLLDYFTDRMRNRVIDKLDMGHAGWNLEGLRNYMSEELSNHLAKGDYLDIANIAMFLDNLNMILEGKGVV